MDIFELAIEPKKFQYTNYFWNKLKLNSKWSIGCVVDIISQRNFNSKDEWKNYYFNSGEERKKELSKLDIDIQNKLNDFKNQNYLLKEYEHLNYQFGRTKEELKERGIYLYKEIKKANEKTNITPQECIYIVKFRTIGETWNGIKVREENTIKTLKELIPNIRIEKTDGITDYKYSVDFEIYYDTTLICGLQIKPQSYNLAKTTEVNEVKKLNYIKNKRYQEEFNVPIIYIYSDIKGNIFNKEAIQQINNLIKKNNFLDRFYTIVNI